MKQDVSLHGWSSEALFNKALLYVGEMETHSADHWQHRLWASLSLELLSRASLAAISPTLLADRNDWRNIHYALGHAPTAKKFVPKSIAVSEVLKILNELLPDFTKELYEACVEQSGHRNVELHSGEEAFIASGTASWLPHYYGSCEIFLKSLGKTLDDLFSDAKSAKKVIASLQDAAAKSVGKDIHDSKVAWASKSGDERATLVEHATNWASRHEGHRTKCPACDSPSLLRGSRSGPVATEIKQDLVIQKQTMLPSTFECIACRLKIAGFSKLSACGLGDAFVSTTTLTPAEYFGLYTEQDLDEARAGAAEPDFEEDFNEF